MEGVRMVDLLEKHILPRRSWDLPETFPKLGNAYICGLALQAHRSDNGKSLSARLLGFHCQDVGWAGCTRMAQQTLLTKRDTKHYVDLAARQVCEGTGWPDTPTMLEWPMLGGPWAGVVYLRWAF